MSDLAGTIYGGYFPRRINYDSFWEVAANHLSDYEFMALDISWHKDGKKKKTTFEKAAKEMGLSSSERFRQLRYRALRKMRHPSYRRIYEFRACPLCGRDYENSRES